MDPKRAFNMVKTITQLFPFESERIAKEWIAQGQAGLASLIIYTQLIDTSEDLDKEKYESLQLEADLHLELNGGNDLDYLVEEFTSQKENYEAWKKTGSDFAEIPLSLSPDMFYYGTMQHLIESMPTEAYTDRIAGRDELAENAYNVAQHLRIKSKKAKNNLESMTYWEGIAYFLYEAENYAEPETELGKKIDVLMQTTLSHLDHKAAEIYSTMEKLLKTKNPGILKGEPDHMSPYDQESLMTLLDTIDYMEGVNNHRLERGHKKAREPNSFKSILGHLQTSIAENQKKYGLMPNPEYMGKN